LKVYKHRKNFELNYFLTGLLVVMLALAVGLGIGHFLGKHSLGPLFSRKKSVHINQKAFQIEMES